MSKIDEIRQRADNGIATLADVFELLGQIATVQEAPPKVVYVPDNVALAKQVQAEKDAAVLAEGARMKAGADAGKAAELAAQRANAQSNLREMAGL